MSVLIDKVMVLTTRGKQDDVDYVQVNIFDCREEANSYIKDVMDTGVKYWTYAEIVSNGQEVELFPYNQEE